MQRITTRKGDVTAEWRLSIDIYDRCTASPNPTAYAPAPDFFEQTKSHALNLQDQIIFTDRLRGMIGARFQATSNKAPTTSPATTRAPNPRRLPPDALAPPTTGLTPEVGVFASRPPTSFKPNGDYRMPVAESLRKWLPECPRNGTARCAPSTVFMEKLLRIWAVSSAVPCQERFASVTGWTVGSIDSCHSVTISY